MHKKNKFHSVHLILFLIIGGTIFTGCHKQKTTSDPIVKEMPMPNVEQNYYSPVSYQKKIVADRDETYEMVEQMPVFPGGEQELIAYVSKSLHYPVIAQENGIQGRVIIRFIVTRTGEIENPEVLRSLDPACDKEAIRVVKSFPKFIPGKQNGVNVSVWFTIPITFTLKK